MNTTLKKNRVGEEYRKFTVRKTVFILLSVVLIFVVSAICMSIGSYHIPLTKIFSIILNSPFDAGHTESPQQIVVWTLRMPRIAMGILTGIGLGVSGAVMQAILRNPLASPTTIGISAAAGLGAALAIIAGVGVTAGKFLLIGNAFIFAMMPAMVIFALARFKKTTPEMMILAGIGMLYIFGSVTSLLQYFAAQDALKSMVVWLMGDLGRAKWSDILAAFGVLSVCVPLLVWKAWDLNLMALGDETARSLGVAVEKNRIFIMMTASLVTAVIICFTGMIGFIGLVSPHICRIAIGGDNRCLIPASGLFGAAFLLFADGIARTILAPVIIPVGIITSCVGGPLFLYLIIRKKKEYWG